MKSGDQMKVYSCEEAQNVLGAGGERLGICVGPLEREREFMREQVKKTLDGDKSFFGDLVERFDVVSVLDVDGLENMNVQCSYDVLAAKRRVTNGFWHNHLDLSYEADGSVVEYSPMAVIYAPWEVVGPDTLFGRNDNVIRAMNLFVEEYNARKDFISVLRRGFGVATPVIGLIERVGDLVNFGDQRDLLQGGYYDQLWALLVAIEALAGMNSFLKNFNGQVIDAVRERLGDEVFAVCLRQRMMVFSKNLSVLHCREDWRKKRGPEGDLIVMNTKRVKVEIPQRRDLGVR